MERADAEAVVRELVASRGGAHDLVYVPVRLDVLRALAASRACAAGFLVSNISECDNRDACARCGFPRAAHAAPLPVESVEKT